MLEAAFWGFVGGAALILGAVLGLALRTPPRVVGIVMAFGAGVLISAVAFELVEESFVMAGASPVLIGLTAGALTFFVGDALIDRRGGEHRKRSGGQQAGGAAGAIVLGAMLDGIPESAAIGVSLLDGGGVGVAVVQAFAGGAILTMLADSMMPEGFEHAGNAVGLVTCAGFIAAFLLGHAA